jgi:YfiR/HmsC-like
LVLAALLPMAYPTPIRAQVSASIEYQVKAAFLLNFAKFIEWPPNTFESKNKTITVCIFGYDPFGNALDDLLKGKNINDRELLARRVRELPDLKTCELVFVSEKEEKRLPEILLGLKGTSALVVGEGEDFAERGGGLQFISENKRLRFAINLDAVQRAHLTISSKLLALAKIVHDRGQSKEN